VTKNTIINGDVLDVLRTLPDESIDLILADPPYNIGVDYGSGPKADRRGDYSEWCEAWVNACWRVLSRTGSIWIISGQEHGAEIDLALQQHFTVRNRITWHETFGVYCHNKFGRCSRPVFYAVKDPKSFTFHREAVLVPSARQEKYGDRRAAAGGKIMGDVWEISRVCGTFKERIKGVPTQLPAELVSRIIRVSSDEGDTVLDPFVGSGTTLAVAKMLGREGVGIEINAEYCEIAESRVANAAGFSRQLTMFS
jgi:DNA modification methylase